MNEQIYKKHLECAATWPRIWTSIKQIIDSNLQGEMEQHYTSLNRKLDKLNNSYPQRTRLATRGHTQEFYPRTINLTNIQFTKDERELLDKGLQYKCNKPAKPTGPT